MTRNRVDAKSQAATRSFTHKVRLRETGFQHRPDQDAQGPSQMTALYAALAQDEKRNDMIFDDVLLSLEAGRRPVILTERRDHLEYFRTRLEKFTRNLVVLYGGMNATERRTADAGMKRARTEERLVLATGRYLGEVIVYDYVDSGVPMLARMALIRQSGYRSLGYEVAAR